jgi:hypothetical protein
MPVPISSIREAESAGERRRSDDLNVQTELIAIMPMRFDRGGTAGVGLNLEAESADDSGCLILTLLRGG